VTEPRRLEDWLNAYLVYTEPQESPASFHYWTGVSTIAGALRRKVFFDQGFFKWTPNFYIVLVAPSGISTKSTTASIGMGLLKEVPGVHFGPSSLTWQSLFPVLNAAQELSDIEGDGLLTPQSCLTFFSSELGTLISPKDADQSMLNWLIELWDGKDFPIERYTKKEGSIRVDGAWVNIIAGTTPNWIAANMSKTSVGGGFTSRCIFVYEDSKRKLVAYPKLQMKKDSHALQKDLLHDLQEIGLLKGEFSMSEDAVTFGVRWYEENYNRLRTDPLLSQFDGYASRKQGHMHKLAMVLSASESNSLCLEKHHLEAAAKVLDELEPTMPKVFGLIGLSPDQEKSRAIEEIVQRERAISKLALYKILFARYAMSWREFEDRLNSAKQAGVLMLADSEGQSFVMTA
jgi:hypothetical protein